MRKQRSEFSVRTVRLQSGERLPMLLAGSTGVPLFEPTLYAVTELRGRGVASATIKQSLQAVMVLCAALERLGVDLNARLADRRLLEAGEIEELVHCCHLPMNALTQQVSPPQVAQPPKVVSLERLRMGETQVDEVQVSRGTAAIRMYYIWDYLKWRVDTELYKLAKDQVADRESFETIGKKVLSALQERAPKIGIRDLEDRRQGLAPEVLARLRELTEPQNARHIWKSQHAAERNALIIRWLLHLGLRRGELLGVRIEDINFQTHEVHIKRRPDDPEDPRINEPNTKTMGRLLALNEELIDLTHKYIVGRRRMLQGARRHSFLFAAIDTGKPLSLVGLNKIFTVLRRKCPDLPDDLIPHLLRHTYASQLTEDMEKNNVPEEIQKKILIRVMGWVEGSKMPGHYTVGPIKQKSREASLGLQRKMRNGDAQ